ncbi:MULTISPECIES: ABC transporter ATP-binding protein [Cryobacterium]|uniref:ABC transporter ATP-binding protein n=1 Tax=Cryobacterium breve TaxID=1259258 RepID=A0ABY2J8V1_9MICO|nr:MULTISPECIES: ABC transporter ATP-binding protein [Cryobacterium]TFC95792.1 ABC transporter ATP-binding protein [Cryobacterium sp. TmT3-12]TFD00231.1 ABC transporter ATP-binding protein [Cryobacterium breve]
MTPAAAGSVSGASVVARGWGWRHAGRRRWAVDGLDLRIEPGERVLLLGASGAGKSTLLHALAGVLGGEEEGEQRGHLLVNGAEPTAERGQAGLLLQDPDSQVILARVGDDVAFGCENLGVPRDEIWRRVTDALRMVGLNLPLGHPTSALSGGQKQRLALAGVLAMRPGLLLLDEPTANLDPEGVLEVRESVARVLENSEATFIVIEHRVAVWQSLVNRVIVLDAAGGVLADGHPDDVLTSQGERLAAAGVWVPGRGSGLVAAGRRTSSGTTPLLRTPGLAIARTKAEIIARDLELDVLAGTALALTGPNGAGKSTLALTLAGLLKPAGGAVLASPEFADGADPEPIRWRSRQLLSRIGTVFQDPEHQFVAATVRAELAVGPRALKRPEAAVTARVDEVLQRLRLDHLAEANPFTLSGGEKRRLSVGTVLATQPQLLVLDEPTFGQDLRTWREIVVLLDELLREGTAVVAVSHDADFVAAVFDREFRLAGRTGAAAPLITSGVVPR